jgi:hypothetical protein
MVSQWLVDSQWLGNDGLFLSPGSGGELLVVNGFSNADRFLNIDEFSFADKLLVKP